MYDIVSTEAYIRHHLLHKSARKYKFFALNILFFLSILSVFVKYLIEYDNKMYDIALKILSHATFYIEKSGYYLSWLYI